MPQTRQRHRRTRWYREYPFSFFPPSNATDPADVLRNAGVVAVQNGFDSDGFEFRDVDVAVVAVIDESDLTCDRFIQVSQPRLPPREVSLSRITSGNRFAFGGVPHEPLGLTGTQPARQPLKKQD